MEITLHGQIESYMRACMRDSAHDVAHVRRVVQTALDIADAEPGADRTIVQAAALLHDIGRGAQFRDPSVCHAEAGAAMALPFLRGCGVAEPDAARICDCIRTHRFRSDRPPVSLEARILFDADKLDAVGTIGLARSLLHKGKVRVQAQTAVRSVLYGARPGAGGPAAAGGRSVYARAGGGGRRGRRRLGRAVAGGRANGIHTGRTVQARALDRPVCFPREKDSTICPDLRGRLHCAAKALGLSPVFWRQASL